MRLDPTAGTIGQDQVTYFSMISGPREHPLYEIIGRIAVEFGRLEYLVKVAIEKLSRELALRDGLRGEDVQFIEGMAQAEREYTFSACCSHLDQLYAKWGAEPERVVEFKNLVERLLRIGEERNGLIHGCWSSSDEGTFLRLRSRYDRKSKSLQQSVERFTLLDLEDFHKTVNWLRFLLFAGIGADIGHIVPIAASEPPMKPSRGTVLLSELMSTANAFGIEPETLSQAVGITVDDMNAVAKGVRTLEPDGPQYGRAAFLSDWLQRTLNSQWG